MLAEIAIVASILCFSYKKSSKIRKTSKMKRIKESYFYLLCLERVSRPYIYRLFGQLPRNWQ
jgi:hypothetical protein